MSDKRKNPIDEAIGVDSPDEEEVLFSDDFFEIEIPPNATLSDVAKLALEAYKEQMLNIQHIEPKYRARALEVAQRYLETARDAIARSEDVRQKDEKIDIERKTKKIDEDPTDETPDESLDRDAVLRRVK